MKTYETWADLDEIERYAWSSKFIELAEKELRGYNGAVDSQTEFPWCAPWTWEGNEKGAILSPEEHLEDIKKTYGFVKPWYDDEKTYGFLKNI